MEIKNRDREVLDTWDTIWLNFRIFLTDSWLPQGTQPMFITAYYLIPPNGHREPRSKVAYQGPVERVKLICVENVPILGIPHYPSVTLPF